jgi:hypothetical protein
LAGKRNTEWKILRSIDSFSYLTIIIIRIKYFKKYQLGKNNEKLWAEILKIFYSKKVKPQRFSDLSHIIDKTKNKMLHKAE